MAQITISDLHPVENEFAELSDLELESVVGGKRNRDYYDVNGDGKTDKVVTNSKTGELIKIKFGR